MTTNATSNILARRAVRSEKLRRGQLDAILKIMDTHNITVGDIQNYIEAIKTENTDYEKLLSKRQRRRHLEKLRQASKLGVEARKAKNNAKGKAKGKKPTNRQTSPNTEGTESQE